MKRVTASEARRNWFRLLDEVVQGEVVMIMRHGRRVLLMRDEEQITGAPRPDYGRILRVREAGRADRWGWEWNERELEFREHGEETG